MPRALRPVIKRLAPTLSGTSRGMANVLVPHSRDLRAIGALAPSAAAQRRFEVVRWFEQHGRIVRLAARHFGYSPDTVSRWVRAFALLGMRGVENRSRRPHTVRRPTTPSAVVVRIRELRERYPRWGREKLRILLAREGVHVSAKTIDRTLARLRARGELQEPKTMRKAAVARARAAERPRRPAGFVVDRPGYLQLDTQELRSGGPFTFSAIDHFTRKRVVAASSRSTSAAGAAFLIRVQERFPFPIWALQTDGGSEFKGEFALAVAAAGITHYVNRPNYPQGNGRIERSFLTDDLEFHQVEDEATTARVLERQLIIWNTTYEQIRPHQALGYLTPNEFYAKWLADQAPAERPLSDMS